MSNHKWPGNGLEMAQKWAGNGPEKAQKWPGNGPEMVQKWPRKRLQNPLIECPHFFSAEIGTILFEAHHSVDSYSFGGSARGIS